MFKSAIQKKYIETVDIPAFLIDNYLLHVYNMHMHLINFLSVQTAIKN